MTPLAADPFSTVPKTSLQAFYDRENELQQLQRAVKDGSRLVLVLGVRRIGKTSLIRVALNQLSKPYVFIDLRALESYEDRSLYRLLADELNKILPLSKKILQYLKRVRGVSVGEGMVSLAIGRDKPNIISMLRTLDAWAADEGFTLPIVFDEAQELRFFRGGRRRIDFRKILGFCYDNLERTTIILSGSEIGLLYSFIGADDPSSPLYGRHYAVIQLERLSKEKSVDFLRKGFEYHGIKPSEEILARAVEEFDGLIGWLTYFGAEAVRLYRHDVRPTLQELTRLVRAKAVELCAIELEKLYLRSPLYLGLLADVGSEGSTWSELRIALEKRFKRTVSDPQLFTLLQNLENLSYIKKDQGRYKVLDPVTAEAARMLLDRRLRRP
ncbi:MAG: ATP-binding protein [Candidatus Caldarchaeum sp.]